jgi:hypothetical protein
LFWQEIRPLQLGLVFGTQEDLGLGFSPGANMRIADAHRDDGKRFVARPDEKLTLRL